MAILTPSTRRIATVALALTVCAASPVFAQDLSPINNFFTTLGEALTGTTGRAIGLVALAAVGLMFLMGRMNWMFAGSVALGLVILYGAGSMLAGFGTA
jgi:type IV secretion system protein VirB2